MPAVLRKNLGVDERVLRTRANIADAVIRIGQERGVDDLTVGELVREAGISRSTFYAHFGNLEHYLSQSFANMVEGMAAHGAYDAGPGDTRLLHRYLDLGVFDVILCHNRFTLVDRSADALFTRAVELGVGVLNAAIYGGGILARPGESTKYSYQPASRQLLETIAA